MQRLPGGWGVGWVPFLQRGGGQRRKVGKGEPSRVDRDPLIRVRCAPATASRTAPPHTSQRCGRTQVGSRGPAQDSTTQALGVPGLKPQSAGSSSGEAAAPGPQGLSEGSPTWHLPRRPGGGRSWREALGRACSLWKPLPPPHHHPQGLEEIAGGSKHWWKMV